MAEGTYTGAVAGGTDSNNIVLSATSGGSAFNGVDVTINVTDVATDATFSSGTLTITASATATTNDLIAAINTQGTFSASTAGGGAGVYTTGTTSAVTNGGDTSGNISDLQIDQANFGTASSIGVQVNIDQQATQGELTYSGGALDERPRSASGRPEWFPGVQLRHRHECRTNCHGPQPGVGCNWCRSHRIRHGP